MKTCRSLTLRFSLLQPSGVCAAHAWKRIARNFPTVKGAPFHAPWSLPRPVAGHKQSANRSLQRGSSPLLIICCVLDESLKNQIREKIVAVDLYVAQPPIANKHCKEAADRNEHGDWNFVQHLLSEMESIAARCSARFQVFD